MERITSRQNALVKQFRALARDGSAAEMLLDGPHLVDEAMRSAIAIEVAAFADSAMAERHGELAERARRADIRTVSLPDKLFDAISPVRQSSGVAAIARRPVAALADVLSPSSALVLVLEAVQDPGNVGAIVRAAEACGATGIVVRSGTADPFGWKALRGAMGSSLRLPIAIEHSPDDAFVATLRAAKVRIVAAVHRGGQAPAAIDLRRSSAIVLGGEGAGIPAALLAAADERLTVPMQPPVESLNVAIAAGLVLYEASRQRAHVAVR